MPRRSASSTVPTDGPMVSRWGGGPVVIRFTVSGPVPRKNSRTRTRIVAPASARRGKLVDVTKCFVQYYPSADWKDWIDRLAAAIPANTKIEAGAWAIRIWTYNARIRHLDEDLPEGDVDSPVSAILDGLQSKNGGVGMLDDDARIVEECTTKHYDRDNPRVVIELTRVDPEPITNRIKRSKKTP